MDRNWSAQLGLHILVLRIVLGGHSNYMYLFVPINQRVVIILICTVVRIYRIVIRYPSVLEKGSSRSRQVSVSIILFLLANELGASMSFDTLCQG